MEAALDEIRQAEGLTEALTPLKEKLEQRFNLPRQLDGERAFVFPLNKVMRICLIASLSLTEKRNISDLKDVQLSKNGNRIRQSFFTKDNRRSVL